MTEEQLETTPRVLICDRTDYIATYSTYVMPDGPMMMVHLDMFYFSPSVLRDMDRVFAAFRSVFKNPIFAHLDEENSASLKLLKRYGFVPVGETPCTDGKTRRVFVHLVIEE